LAAEALSFTDKSAVKLIGLLVIGVVLGSSASLRAADAKANWKANCAMCHGAAGAADTPMGKQLNAKDFTDPKVQASFTDAKAVESIKNGIKENGQIAMMAFDGKLTDDEIKALVAYLRTLKK
jgi:mono/diheme cytochrome c family protein